MLEHVTQWQPEFERLAFDLAALRLPEETVDRLLSRLHAACQSLADEGIVEVNPLSGVLIPDAGGHEHRRGNPDD